MSDLCEVIGSSSRMTVFRRLREIEYVSIYTHAGRYYTIYDIARFDSDGVWFVIIIFCGIFAMIFWVLNLQ